MPYPFFNNLTTALPAAVLLLFASCQKDLSAPETGAQLRPLTTQELKTVESSNQFAFRSFAKISEAEQGKNVFISPLSISMALTMAYNGAGGTTKEAIRQTLGFALQTDEEINASFKSLTGLLQNTDRKVTFTAANSLWYRNGYQLQAPFLQANQTYFDATVQGLDFASPTAKTQINNWVKDKTQGKITTIVDEIRPEHVLFLVNAIYFKGTWTQPFDKQLTHKSTFQTGAGTTVQADFMTQKGAKFRRYQDAERLVVDLPYGNKHYSMTMVMPLGTRTVTEEAKSLHLEQLTEWLSRADSSKMDLYLPKFTLEYKKQLKETLTQLGMGVAFGNGADFSRMLEGNQQNLAITEVLHKTFVAVDEEGTEAAAATSVGIGVTSLPPSVRLDRPFLFMIREKSSGTILFIGQLHDPS